MTGEELQRLREEYQGALLDVEHVDADPLVQMRCWLADAIAAEVPMANAMTLATTGLDGRPSARIVLLKEIDDRGLVFFTNYQSRKAAELDADGRAALVLWWHPLHRQLRVEGRVARVESPVSDAYFASRPRDSNLSAIASPQSRPVASRADLEQLFADTARAWNGRELERPDSWGGYRVMPELVELWQGRENRLHDRLQYERQDGQWQLVRLAP